MSEENDEQEETPEPDETEESEEEQEGEQPEEDAAKLKRALERTRAQLKKTRSDLAKTRKEAQQGDPNLGEMEKLTKTVEQLQANIAQQTAVTSLLEAGFNGTAAQAARMIRLVDNLDDEEWVEELKVDFPERFGKRRTADGGPRPFTGGGREDRSAPKKDADTRFAEKLMAQARRS